MATGRFKCAAQVCDWVEKTFGRRFSASGMRKLLERLGCSFHKVSGFLFKADQDKQKEFVAEYEYTDEDGIVLPLAKAKSGPAGGPDRERLEKVLQELVACRQLLDSAMKDS